MVTRPGLQLNGDGGTIAIVPIRSLVAGKTRLAGAVDAESRAELIRLMLGNVLRALGGTAGIDRVLVVSPDPDALALAASILPGVEALRQPEDAPGLLAALELGRERAIALGAGAVMTVFGDLPRLAATDLMALLGRAGEVVVAPDRLGEGTNALVLRGRAVAAFPFRFGMGSRRAHLVEADRLGLATAVVVREGLAFDLDTPGDLAWLPDAMTRATPWMAAS